MGLKTLKRGKKMKLTEREKRIIRGQLRTLKESVARGGPDDRVMSARGGFRPTREAREGRAPMRRPRFTEAQRQHELRYLRDSAIESIQTFAEAYHGRKPYGTENALDMAATFHEAYERAQGKTRTMEARLMTVRHSRGCERKFRMALPGSHRLVTGERGIKTVQAECPHCGEKMNVRLPEGKVAQAVDDGGDKSVGDGMKSDRQPDRGDIGDDSQDDNLRDVGEDEEEDEDEEESEGDDRRGPTPDEEPRSGPYRPGAGARDSLRSYYGDRPEKLVRLAKDTRESKRLREAAAAFLRVLDHESRLRRD
jgi:hypothetical protein